MGSFKTYLQESEDALTQINDILNGMDAEEVDEFGYYLYSEFFDEGDPDEEEDEAQFFSKSDIDEMIADLGSDYYEDILYMLEEEEYEDESEEDEEMDEAVSRIMKASNRNKKKRKFMGKSTAELRRTKAARKRDARSSRAERKRYYKANKKKIQAYQKSRRDAIKSGKHKVKIRRKAG